MAMPPPIVPAPMMPTLLTGTRRRAFGAGRRSWQPGARRRRRSAARPTRTPFDQFAEQLALDLHALVEGQVHRRLDALDVGLGRLEAAESLGVGLAEVGEELRRGAGHAPCRAPSSAGASRPAILRAKAMRRVAQVCPRARVRPPGPWPGRLAAGTGSPTGHHLQRLGRADDARQPLRAAGAGQQAELHFGQAARAPRARPRGSGTPAPSRGRRRARCRGSPPPPAWSRLSILSHSRSRRRALGRLAELADVGTGNEGAAGADQHDGLHRCRRLWPCRRPPSGRRARWRDSAFTGGEFEVITATPSSMLRSITSLMAAIVHVSWWWVTVQAAFGA